MSPPKTSLRKGSLLVQSVGLDKWMAYAHYYIQHVTLHYGVVVLAPYDPSPQCLATTDPLSYLHGFIFSRISYRWNHMYVGFQIGFLHLVIRI